MHNIIAIILAAGSGSRMNSNIKKQFIEIKEKPIIAYTIEKFEKCKEVNEIIVVTNELDIEYLEKNIIKKYNFDKVVKIIAGGDERYNSVFNALSEIKEINSIVIIHDGARPFVNDNIIKQCINEAEKNGACIVGVPVKDTIKVIDEEGYIINTPNRSNLYNVQTPQVFKLDIIKEAYDKYMNDTSIKVTDDSMVVEKYSNIKVKIIEGDYTNIKITTPEDLIFANTLI